METISVKFEDTFVHDMEKIMKQNRYATKAEFIREAIREKIKYLEIQELEMRLKRAYGASNKKTTDQELHKARKEAFEEIAKKFK